MKTKNFFALMILIFAIMALNQLVSAQTQIANGRNQTTISYPCNCTGVNYGCTSGNSGCSRYCALYCRNRRPISDDKQSQGLSVAFNSNVVKDQPDNSISSTPTSAVGCNCSRPDYGCFAGSIYCKMYCVYFCRNRHPVAMTEESSFLNEASITNITMDPASKFFTIEIPSAEESTLQFFNSQGKLVHEEKFYSSTQLDISNFSNGMYAVKWNDGQDVETSLISISKL